MTEGGSDARQVVQSTIATKTLAHDLTVEPSRDPAGAVVAITCASLDVTGQQGGEWLDTGANRTSRSGKDGGNP